MSAVLFPVYAHAAQTELYIDKGDIIIGQTSVFGYGSDGNPVIMFNLDGYIIKQTDPSVSTVHNIKVNSGNIKLTLNGVNIQAINTEKGTTRNALNIASGASVILKMVGGNTLASSDTYGAENGTAAVHVPSGASLIIPSDADGILYVWGGSEHGAAIGGNKNESCGTVEINGGTIQASSGYYAAAIGGGFGGGSGTITINGGSVDAIGHGASGIGLGYEYTGSTPGSITITGGYVAARDEASGVGIGSGIKASVGCPVTITGGTVNAKGWAGIGGYNGAVGNLTITGGSVYASSSYASALTVQASNGTTNVYQTLLTLPVRTGISAVTYKQGGSSITYPSKDMVMDSNNRLFLYLPQYNSGETVVTVTLSGGTVYTYHGSVNNIDNVLKMDQAALRITNLDNMYEFPVFDPLFAPATAGGSGEGAVTYLYEGTNDTSYSSATAPKAIGTYKATATKAADAMYHAALATKEFKIAGDIEYPVYCTINFDSIWDYTGLAITPTVNVAFDGRALNLGTDYKVQYSDNTYPGTATITITGIDTGIGLYTGTVTKNFTIQKISLQPGLSASPASSAPKGNTVTLTATINDLAAVPGTASFKYGTEVIASGVAFTGSMFNWTATAEWSGAAIGNYTVSVEYVPNGDKDFILFNLPNTLNYSITKYLQSGFAFSEGTVTKTYGEAAFAVAATGGESGGGVTYSSGDESIATVDETTGLITMLKAGAVTITATKAGDTDYEPAIATVSIHINKATQTGFAFKQSELYKTYGSGPVSVAAEGGQSTGVVTYSSGDTSIASVDGATGVVTMLKSGEVTIIAQKAEDDRYNNTQAMATIHIAKADQTGFRFADSTINKAYGDSAFTVMPEGGQGMGEVTYSSNDGTIASVGKTTGLVTIQKTGDVIITAQKAADDCYNQAQAAVTIHVVKADQTGFRFADSTITKVFGDIAFTVQANGGQSSGAIVYVSGNKSIATVDENTGLVTLLKAGTVTITATKASDGNYNSAAATMELVVQDRTVPTGSIKIAGNSWMSFINRVTFGLFCKETESVTILAQDETGIASIQYYQSSAALSLGEVNALTAWNTYNAPLALTPQDAEKCIFYAKIADTSGNVAYISSDGITFDTQAPRITTDYTKEAGFMTVTVTDTGSGVTAVTYAVNGGGTQSAVLDLDGKFTIVLPAGGRDVVIRAEDKVGNQSVLTVNTSSAYTVSFILYKGYTGGALKTQTVESGNSATAPVVPIRTGFRFKGWDCDFSNIRGDTVVCAEWDIGGISITPYGGVYDGNAHNAAAVSGTLSGDVITFSTNGASFSADCPQFTNAGSYDVYVRIDRSGYTAWESGRNTAVIGNKVISKEMVADIPAAAYTGQPVEPLPQVKDGANVLLKDKDYTVSYQDNTNSGQAFVIIKGKGNYTGSASKTFAIYSKSVKVDSGNQAGSAVSAEVENLYNDETVYTQEDKQIEQSGGTVTLELFVQQVNGESEDGRKIEDNLHNQTVGLYLDISLLKTITLAGEDTGTTSKVNSSGRPVSVVIPLPDSLKGKTSLGVYRVMDSNASILPAGEENAIDGEYCEIGEDSITLHIHHFRTYAIICDNNVSKGTGLTVAGGEAGIMPTIIIILVVLFVIGIVLIVLKCRRKNKV